jgi:hypothetical protein
LPARPLTAFLVSSTVVALVLTGCDPEGADGGGGSGGDGGAGGEGAACEVDTSLGLDTPFVASFGTEVTDAATMSLPELKRYVADLESSGANANKAQVEYHRKIAFPLVALVMTLIAVPFAVTTGRRGAHTALVVPHQRDHTHNQHRQHPENHARKIIAFSGKSRINLRGGLAGFQVRAFVSSQARSSAQVLKARVRLSIA